MKLLLFALAVFVSCCQGASIPKRLGLWATPTLSRGRIVGGWDAPEGSAIYQASLRQSNSHFCGGSILNTRWILTAAHCVIGATPSDLNVTIATRRLDQGGDTYTLDRVIWHAFDWDKGQNDTALLRTSTEMVFGPLVGPIVLETNEHVETGTQLTLTGFGTLVMGGPVSVHLQLAHFTAITLDDCRSFFTGGNFMSVEDTQICAWSLAGTGACHGDSGSPLTANGRQVGIASWVAPPCGQSFPDVYTRVPSFVPWIESVISEE